MKSFSNFVSVGNHWGWCTEECSRSKVTTSRLREVELTVLRPSLCSRILNLTDSIKDSHHLDTDTEFCAGNVVSKEDIVRYVAYNNDTDKFTPLKAKTVKGLYRDQENEAYLLCTGGYFPRIALSAFFP